MSNGGGSIREQRTGNREFGMNAGGFYFTNKPRGKNVVHRTPDAECWFSGNFDA